jgi:hypothetical protein
MSCSDVNTQPIGGTKGTSHRQILETTATRKRSGTEDIATAGKGMATRRGY